MPNYVWFIIGGVVLLLAIIGFIADKGKKKKEPRMVKEENTESKEVVAPVVETVAPIEPEVQFAFESSSKNDISDDLYAPLTPEEPIAVEEVPQDIFGPMNSDVSATTENDAFTILNPPVPGIEDNAEIDPSLFQPIGENTGSFPEITNVNLDAEKNN